MLEPRLFGEEALGTITFWFVGGRFLNFLPKALRIFKLIEVYLLLIINIPLEIPFHLTDLEQLLLRGRFIPKPCQAALEMLILLTPFSLFLNGAIPLCVVGIQGRVAELMRQLIHSPLGRRINHTLLRHS